jgi:hypothetical protein
MDMPRNIAYALSADAVAKTTETEGD